MTESKYREPIGGLEVDHTWQPPGVAKPIEQPQRSETKARLAQRGTVCEQGRGGARRNCARMRSQSSGSHQDAWSKRFSAIPWHNKGRYWRCSILLRFVGRSVILPAKAHFGPITSMSALAFHSAAGVYAPCGLPGA